MDIPRLNALNKYWDGHPPLHIMVASYFGVLKVPKKENTQSDMNELAAICGEQ